MQVRKKLKLQIGEYDWQTLLGFIRLFVFGLFLVIAIGVYGSTRLDGVDPREIAAQYRRSYWFLHYISEPVLVIIASIFNGHSLRYMIAPASAIVCILMAGAYFVQDVYALPSYKKALHYVVASMFGVEYPNLIIDRGTKQVFKGEVNLIDKIGGPGFAIIEPGNAAMFRKLRGPSEASVSETYFLAPFEKLASAVTLDEQQGIKESMTALTRDGIKVSLNDIHFRYRIKQQEERHGEPIRRSIANPYPFSVAAIRDMTFNLQVQKNGLETWQTAVERSVTGGISDFVASRSIDYLTAPRTNDFNPRLELRNQLFLTDMKKRLEGLGAELLWVDVGHIEIEDESVDELRTNLWSADWAGDAAEIRAYGDAIRQAYQQLGRAEAQADLIMSISGALAEANVDGASPENVRRLLIARTAQLLDAMNDGAKTAKKAGDP